jgi:hypothetical protein
VDWREFIASLVDSAAWPIAVVAIVALMRTRLTRILENGALHRLKLGPAGAELEWQQVAAEVRAEVVSSKASTGGSPIDGGPGDLSELDGLAARSPADAIGVASSVLLGELRRLVRESKPELLADYPSPHVLLKTAHHEGVISRENAEALRGMLTLRDLTAHRPETATVERAVDFIVMARAVLYALSRA